MNVHTCVLFAHMPEGRTLKNLKTQEYHTHRGGGKAACPANKLLLEVHMGKFTLTGVFVLLQGLATGVRQHLDREVDAVDGGNVVVVYTRVHLLIAQHISLFLSP